MFGEFITVYNIHYVNIKICRHANETVNKWNCDRI